MHPSDLLPSFRGERPDQILKRVFFPGSGTLPLDVCMKDYVYDTKGSTGRRMPAETRSKLIRLHAAHSRQREQSGFVQQEWERNRSSGGKTEGRAYAGQLYSLEITIGGQPILRKLDSRPERGRAAETVDPVSGDCVSYAYQSNTPGRFFGNLISIARKRNISQQKMLTVAAFLIAMLSEKDGGDECSLRLCEDVVLRWRPGAKNEVVAAVRGLKGWMWEKCWELGEDADLAFCMGAPRSIVPVRKAQDTVLSTVAHNQGQSFLTTMQDRGWRIVLKGGERAVKENFTPLLWDEIAADILRETERFPLFRYYYRIPDTEVGGYGEQKEDAEILGILKLSSEITLRYIRGHIEKKVRIAPLIRSTDRWLEQEFDLYFRERDVCFTGFDLLRFLGRKAAEARERPHTFALNEETDDPVERAVREELEREDGLLSPILRRERGAYKFCHKPLRLLIDGFAASSSSEGEPAREIADRLLSYAGDNEDPERDSPDHTAYDFGNLVIFACSFLYRLSDGVRQETVRALIDTAEDYRGRNRQVQEKAICILSYLLCEEPDIPGALRDQIFISTYGNALYRLQETEWQYLSDRRPYYRSYVRRLWEKCCTRVDGYAEEEPRFLYLRRMEQVPKKRPSCRNGEEFLDWCCEMRHHVWFDGEIGQYRPDEVLDALAEAGSLLKAMPSDSGSCRKERYRDNGLCVLYGAQMLLTSLSSLSLRVSQKEEDPEKKRQLSQILESFTERLKADGTLCGDLLETAVYADYQMRLSDRYYNIPPETRTGEEGRKMYLLCGPFRFICAYYPYLDQNRTSVSLTEEKNETYVRWYRTEHGRYRMLLARLLSFAGISADILEEGLEQAYRDDTPLSYDALPSDAEALYWELRDRQERMRIRVSERQLG